MIEEETGAESYPSSDWLQDAGEGILLQLEQVRWLTVHLETVGVVVELHWTHKVAVASHHVGELEGEQGSVTLHHLQPQHQTIQVQVSLHVMERTN